jgi:hypothetical protein
MKICLLDKTNFEYSYDDLYSEKLRGAEMILINLSKNLSELGHQVFVINNCSKKVHMDKSNNWFNINMSNEVNLPIFDVSISNADTNLLNLVQSKKKFIISYSLQSIEKFLRKNQLFSYLKNKPKVLLLGNDHKTKRSRLLSLFGSVIIDLSIDDIFIKTTLLPSKEIDSNLAIFSSRPERNSQLLLNIWRDKIFPNFRSGKLLITENNKSFHDSNIMARKLGNQNDLINDLLRSRMFLVPGHKAELFCLAAEEARELCLPIVTLGIGSLKERVVHGETGFIAKNENQFANYVLELFKNDDLWTKLRNNLISKRGQNNWTKATKNLISKIN